ncbi:hypothetical protein EDD16DRAFT_1521525 [Pisolithus croceorrhizus]|nr:hypothetical protein EDD16DRAFT_1521525 [Pisolithus croceorrhizus]KAI6169744.1 hypothetical protein EDD17DRAFT_1502674 [Pisolithus thermaeus]
MSGTEESARVRGPTNKKTVMKSVANAELQNRSGVLIMQNAIAVSQIGSSVGMIKATNGGNDCVRGDAGRWQDNQSRRSCGKACKPIGLPRERASLRTVGELSLSVQAVMLYWSMRLVGYASQYLHEDVVFKTRLECASMTRVPMLFLAACFPSGLGSSGAVLHVAHDLCPAGHLVGAGSNSSTTGSSAYDIWNRVLHRNRTPYYTINHTKASNHNVVPGDSLPVYCSTRVGLGTLIMGYYRQRRSAPETRYKVEAVQIAE